MLDLVYVMHAVTGGEIPTNKEWYCAPIDTSMATPWHILFKWCISTLAGFEGGTKVYVNIIDPWMLRDKAVPHLLDLCTEGKFAPGISIATECSCRVNSPKYNPHLRHR